MRLPLYSDDVVFLSLAAGKNLENSKLWWRSLVNPAWWYSLTFSIRLCMDSLRIIGVKFHLADFFDEDLIPHSSAAYNVSIFQSWKMRREMCFL